MCLSFWAAFGVCLTFTVINVCAEDVVMTWHIQTKDANHTVNFTMDKFKEFNECMCRAKTSSCEVFGATDGDLRISVSDDQDLRNNHANEYMCEQLNKRAAYIQCTRLSKNQCSNVTLCWPHQSELTCELGQLKIFWNLTQTFEMTYISNEMTVPKCDSSCVTKPTSVSPTSSTSSSTTTTSSSVSACHGECTTTNTPTKAPTSTLSTLSSTSPSTFSSKNTTHHMDDNTNPQPNSDDTTRIIIGVVVGVVTCVSLVTVGLIVIRCWRKSKAHHSEHDGNNQLSSRPVEIIHGGFNAFAEHRNRSNGDANMADSTGASYANISANSTFPNGNSASYYNLKRTEDPSLPPEYENSGARLASDNDSDEYFRNGSHFGQDNASFSDSHGQDQTPNRSNSQNSRDDDNDGMEYEEVKNVPNAYRQAKFDNSNQPKINKKSDKISPKPGASQVSGSNSAFKDDTRYESINLGGPKMDGVYSEVSELADNTVNEDIVPPKRQRFLTPLSPSQTPNHQPPVYELAKPTPEPSVTHSADNGPYAHLRDNESNPVNPYNCVGGAANDDVYDSGSRTYFELESRASIRIKDTDSEQD